MCNCKNIEIGSYDNQDWLINWWNFKKIYIDKCLITEMYFLWSKKIRTTGCCCGHNKKKPYINVIESDHEKMVNLNYENWTNEFNVICYKPKFL
jgi:hypothetical protein